MREWIIMVMPTRNGTFLNDRLTETTKESHPALDLNDKGSPTWQ